MSLARSGVGVVVRGLDRARRGRGGGGRETDVPGLPAAAPGRRSTPTRPRAACASTSPGAALGQTRSTDVELVLRTHGPWQPSDVDPQRGGALCVWLRGPGPARRAGACASSRARRRDRAWACATPRSTARAAAAGSASSPRSCSVRSRRRSARASRRRCCTWPPDATAGASRQAGSRGAGPAARQRRAVAAGREHDVAARAAALLRRRGARPARLPRPAAAARGHPGAPDAIFSLELAVRDGARPRADRAVLVRRPGRGRAGDGRAGRRQPRLALARRARGRRAAQALARRVDHALGLRVLAREAEARAGEPPRRLRALERAHPRLVSPSSRGEHGDRGRALRRRGEGRAGRRRARDAHRRLRRRLGQAAAVGQADRRHPRHAGPRLRRERVRRARAGAPPQRRPRVRACRARRSCAPTRPSPRRAGTAPTAPARST